MNYRHFAVDQIMKQSFALALLFLFTGNTLSHAIDCYVSPNVDDTNSGSEDHPWKTIQKAADTLNADDSTDVLFYLLSPRPLKEGGYGGGGHMVNTHFPGPFTGVEERTFDAIRSVVDQVLK